VDKLSSLVTNRLLEVKTKVFDNLSDHLFDFKQVLDSFSNRSRSGNNNNLSYFDRNSNRSNVVHQTGQKCIKKSLLKALLGLWR